MPQHRAYVYVAGQHGGPYKIGFSRNLTRRLANLRAERKQDIRILATFPTVRPRMDERALLIALEGRGVGGEWFDLKPRQAECLLAYFDYRTNGNEIFPRSFLAFAEEWKTPMRPEDNTPKGVLKPPRWASNMRDD